MFSVFNKHYTNMVLDACKNYTYCSG